MVYKVFLFIVLSFASSMLVAQDEATSKFIDSLSMPAHITDTEVLEAPEPATDNDTDSLASAGVLLDTAIVSIFRPIDADSLRSIKKDKGFYYQSWLDSLLRADEAAEKVKEPLPKVDLSGLAVFFQVLQIVLWVLAAGLLVFILYKLFLGNSPLFLRNRKNIDAVIELNEEAVAAGNYEALIKKAESAHNYRLAVSYLHLQALYNLSQKGYINLAAAKTNYQYLDELRVSRQAAAASFSDITYKYEYIWYGGYPISSSTYQLLRERFEAFNNKLS